MKVFLFIFFTLTFYLGFTQEKKIFPSISGVTLTGKNISIPETTKGKYTLVGLAYSQKTEADLQTWVEPIYTVFIDQSGLFTYDIHLYFITLITGFDKTASGNIEKRLKKELDSNLLEHIIFYKGESKKYKTELLLKDKEVPYFFILNKEGVIVYSTSGQYADQKMEEIESHLEEALTVTEN
jgi:hypothetical protein